jgi:translation initiation factor 3 subunit M
VYIANLKNEQGELEAPYVKQIEALLKSDKKDTVFAEIAKDASILLTENNKG